ncbi:nuclease-related domain-containing protein [Exiguobacterium sp. MMG028]|uniref:nuclease-related domain-containing protein n=1 Tax=Exiguobacterium sp. MMG028 TaxID=3021979 RepID=UPI0022FEE2DD|nr:nuclease-related domain-containing protein [Exiguobacterium sp. MMG028]MDA5561522.1 nuclease-related domain-containing protein [Exiguobacterium sp. MMG028]
MTTLLTELLENILVTLLVIFTPIFLVLASIIVYKVRRYKRSQYYEQTRHSYVKVIQDTGLYGEYLCVADIESTFFQPLILTNLYLPHPSKKDRTTEIDVVFINQAGIHVIESKNYSGWIFGRARDQYWTQTLPRRRKHRFFNPIKQNELHLKAIEQVLGLDRTHLHSWIVFSNRSTLKQIESSDVPVLNRQQWAKQLTTYQDFVFDQDEQIQLYETLLSFTQVDAAIMMKHVEDIESAYKR